jgi:hypothetical protein
MANYKFAAFLDFVQDAINQEANADKLLTNRFALENSGGEIIRCTWARIQEVADNFRKENNGETYTFQHLGFECRIVFCLSQFNGYIQMTQAQRDWFEANRDKLEAYQPHGGITCETSGGGPGFGFDCAHFTDIQTNPMSRSGPMFEVREGATFKTPDFVRGELIRWAEHLHAILPEELRN